MWNVCCVTPSIPSTKQDLVLKTHNHRYHTTTPQGRMPLSEPLFPATHAVSSSSRPFTVRIRPRSCSRGSKPATTMTQTAKEIPAHLKLRGFRLWPRSARAIMACRLFSYMGRKTTWFLHRRALKSRPHCRSRVYRAGF